MLPKLFFNNPSMCRVTSGQVTRFQSAAFWKFIFGLYSLSYANISPLQLQSKPKQSFGYIHRNEVLILPHYLNIHRASCRNQHKHMLFQCAHTIIIWQTIWLCCKQTTWPFSLSKNLKQPYSYHPPPTPMGNLVSHTSAKIRHIIRPFSWFCLIFGLLMLLIVFSKALLFYPKDPLCIIQCLGVKIKPTCWQGRVETSLTN